jgi:hypothetical protein
VKILGGKYSHQTISVSDKAEDGFKYLGIANDDKFQLKHSFNHNAKEPQRYYAIIPNNKRHIKTKRHLGA